MGVWKVPDDEVLETGKRMAAFRGISHCYQRPTYPDWPYSVFTMAHALEGGVRRDPRLDRRRDGITERATLYSSTEFKKVRMLYFTDDFRRWEEERADHLYVGRRSASSAGGPGAPLLLPGGVNSPVRAMRSIGRDPLFIDRAEGAEITDVDGNTYVDYVCSWDR